jgi:uroporphyrinogen III methyltransferase/synthase
MAKGEGDGHSAPVALVGAGPGHPELLTLRAVACLSQADLVLYDRLVPAELLVHAPQARKVCVDELAGCHVERVPLVHQAMIDAARQGLRVVRLKGGDPFVFGRGGEEALALREAGIAYEIVPGVTAALGAAGCAGIPLTHRHHASAVALVTGHEGPDKPGSLIDWAALAHFPGTLVFYMAVSRVESIVTYLLEHGKPGDTPAAAIERGSTARQRTVQAPLAELSAAVQRDNIQAPALVVIGAVVRLRDQLAWFEDRPLFGRRVVVTRPRHQAAEMVQALEELGASPVVLPAVDIIDPVDPGPLDAALAQLGSYQWLVFTSVNGVSALLGRLLATGRDLRALAGLKLAAIGPATADALRDWHLLPDLVPATFNSEGLVEALRERVRGQRVLLARADRGIELLRDELSQVAEVEQVAVYSQVDVQLDEGHPVLQQLREGAIEFVTLTSSNIARVFLGALDNVAREQVMAGRVRLVTISPRTSETVRALGYPLAGEAREYTTRGVIEALCALAKEQES